MLGQLWLNVGTLGCVLAGRSTQDVVLKENENSVTLMESWVQILHSQTALQNSPEQLKKLGTGLRL